LNVMTAEKWLIPYRLAATYRQGPIDAPTADTSSASIPRSTFRRVQAAAMEAGTP
jgi:hypothetical protein